MGTMTLDSNNFVVLNESKPAASDQRPPSVDPTHQVAGAPAWSSFAVELAWRLADVGQRLDVATRRRFASQLDVVREALAAAVATTGPDRGRTMDIASDYLGDVEERLLLLADPMALSPGDHIRFSGRTVQVVRVTGTTYESLVLEVSDGESSIRRACVRLRDPVRLVPSGGA